MTKDEALKLALKRLEYWYDYADCSDDSQAIIAIKEALAQPEQEPVAWRHDMGEENGGWEYFEQASCHDCQPLYTTPPQRKPLTEKQIKEALSDMSALQMPINKLIPAIARAIEAAHGIKGEA